MLKRKLSERAPAQTPPPGEIVDMLPHEMSAVDYGANDAPFLTVREAEAAGVKPPQTMADTITKAIMDGFKQISEKMFKTQRSDESAMTDTQAPAVVESAVVKMDDAEWEKLGEYVKAECSKMIEPYEARIKAIEEKIGQTEESTEATAQAVAEVEKNFESKLDMVVTSIQKALNVTTAPNAQPGVTPEPAQHESQKSLWPTGINRAINSAAKARN